MERFEFFGDESQIVLQRRYYRLWQYLKSHRRLSFVGRAIGLDDPTLDEAAAIAGLAKELGFLALSFTKASIVDELREALEERGLQVGLWHQLVSDEQTESKCRSVMTTRQLQSGYRIERITQETAADRLEAYQELMHLCGVSPLPGYILRGQDVPTIAAMILSSLDEVVASGVGIFRHNPMGTYGRAAHVGFLATDVGHRDQGFAHLLLAHIIVASCQEYGADLLHTGVRADNITSWRVCQACGLDESGMYFVGVAYPPVLERVQFTS